MEVSLNNVVVVISTTLLMFFLFHERIRNSSTWRATVTPLASIIGSGFFVSAPLLFLSTGYYASLVMLAIILVAYALGWGMRFNIQYLDPYLKTLKKSYLVNKLRFVSLPILGIAYLISVAFYLKLLSAFVLQGAGIHNVYYENCLTTGILLFIGILGFFHGLAALEFFATYSVNIKVSIILSLIITQFFYNFELMFNNEWALTIHPESDIWTSFRKVLGMFIIIQGFETSQFLGYAYHAKVRIQTMRYAQWISGIIYLLYIISATVVFNTMHNITETSIIDASKVIASVLPIFLIIAATMSQFSASVADTIGSGGLLVQSLKGKVTINQCYVIIMIGSTILTWTTNIFEIITIASKAFAVYYAVELILGMILIAKQKKHEKYRLPKIAVYSLLFVLMVLVVSLGIPAESQ